jgi:hypothetical protein
MKRLNAAACAVLLFALPVATPAQTPSPDPDAMLAQAVAAPGLESLSVPVHFLVHAHAVLDFGIRADGIVYYRAPDQTVFAITKVSGILGVFFKGSYKLDFVPQGWPATYRVLSVTKTESRGAFATVFRVVPRRGGGDLTDVRFTFTSTTPETVAAEWHFRDASSVRLTLVTRSAGAYSLPDRATIAVDKPHARLTADATYGDYAVNVAIPASVFAAAK